MQYDLGRYDEYMKYNDMLGALKDEAMPDFITEDVGLRATVYS